MLLLTMVYVIREFALAGGIGSRNVTERRNIPVFGVFPVVMMPSGKLRRVGVILLCCPLLSSESEASDAVFEPPP